MSETLDQIKQLQQDLFVEEHGVTQEQAKKLNEFIYWEPTGKQFDSWLGREVPKPSVHTLISELEAKTTKQSERLSEMEWEHKKLWLGVWIYVIISVSTFAIIISEMNLR